MARKKDKEVSTLTDEQLESFNKELFNELHGKMFFGPEFKDSNLQSVSTGSMKLNWALGTPIVEGSVVELYGKNSCGKTTLSLEIAANAIALGKQVYFIDIERKLRESQLNMIDKLDRSKFIVIRPDTGEEAVNIIHKCVTQVPGCLFIFDSVSALLPEVEDAEGAESQQMGLVARLCWKMMRKNLGPISRNKCIGVFISHLTTQMNPYGSKDIVKGGKAVEDMASQRIRLSRQKTKDIKDDNGNIIGQTITCFVSKNNMNRPGLTVDVPLIYGSGIDKESDLFELACDLALFDYRGGWITYNEKKYRRNELLELFKSDGDFYNKIKEEVSAILY